MELKPPNKITTDVLVIGGGGAGLRAAIEARKHNVEVLLISQSPVGYANNTAIAGGGLAAVTGTGNPLDNPEIHFRDTIIAGRLINDQRLVKVMTNLAAQQISDLDKLGVKFVKGDDTLLLLPAAGHTYPRTVLGEGTKGTALTRPLRQYAEGVGIQFMETILVTKLLKTKDSVFGAVGVSEGGEVFVFDAKSTILATGGPGEMFLRTSNVPGATGDGYALACEAGVPLQDMEFVQFYPTSLGGRGTRSLVLYEQLTPIEGVVIRNSLGEDVLERYGISEPYLATRDRVARSIMLELLEGRDIDGTVVIDLEAVSDQDYQQLSQSIPALTHERKKKFPVAPTAHFFMGGVKINENCETEIEGLFAAGEVAGGIHGANRLSSNALTDIFVFGAIAGKNAAERALKLGRPPMDEKQARDAVDRLRELASSEGSENLEKLRDLQKETMWHNVGIIRNQKSLENALQEIRVLAERYKRISIGGPRELVRAIELGNMLTVSEIIARAALERTESRGAHYRSDYPDENNQDWLKNIALSLKDGQMTLSTVHVDLVEIASFS